MKDNFKIDPWKVIQIGFDSQINQTAESLFSLGNGRLGGRGNHIFLSKENSLSGNYIAGIYYPDKTKVGWWKNGYPEYFAKVINSVNWLEIEIEIGGEPLKFHQDTISDYESILDMQTGLLSRSYKVKNSKDQTVSIKTERFFDMAQQDMAYVKCIIKSENFSDTVKVNSILNFDVRNQDSNYDEVFWEMNETETSGAIVYGKATTKKTNFQIAAGLKTIYRKNSDSIDFTSTETVFAKASQVLEIAMEERDEITLIKNCCIVSELYYPENSLVNQIKEKLASKNYKSFTEAYDRHSQSWKTIWEDCDILISGDEAAQQGIRFNIFQLYQTYRGDDARLNIGPKGFTGEKYGGVTYWDTEAYCLPFYMSTTSSDVARNLLKYRYNHLEKAIENGEKLGFKNGAALYPMVTMNGEECHNEWEITFEEIHRNGAIAYAIYDYSRYNDDKSYLHEFGIYVLIAIARFWAQRVI